MSSRRIVAASGFVLALAGCVGTMSPTGQAEEGGAGMDEPLVLARVARFRSSPDFVRLSARTYDSALGEGVRVNVYVSRAAFVHYGSVVPERDGSGVVLPEGATIVREVVDAAGVPQKLTLMVKGPPGYNPELGDYWFGVTTPEGRALVVDGVPQTGRLRGCFACHDERGEDDFVFGVPGDNRW